MHLTHFSKSSTSAMIGKRRSSFSRHLADWLELVYCSVVLVCCSVVLACCAPQLCQSSRGVSRAARGNIPSIPDNAAAGYVGHFCFKRLRLSCQMQLACRVSDSECALESVLGTRTCVCFVLKKYRIGRTNQSCSNFPTFEFKADWVHESQVNLDWRVRSSLPWVRAAWAIAICRKKKGK